MNALTRSKEFLLNLRRACSSYQLSYPAAVFRSLYLYCVSKFSLKEIIGYGLFVPSITANMPVLISKERSLERLNILNPPNLQHLTEDKDEFYRICREHSLPIPKTYGWTRDGRRYDADGRLIGGEDAWADYLSAGLPEDFIVKDRAGTDGSGFCAFRRTGDSFRRVDSGDVYGLNGLLEAFSVAGDASGIIVQKRLFDAAPLCVLSGRRGLQTMRINTQLYPDGRVSILFYMIKILAGPTVSDNFSMGTTGNLIAYGDPDDGILRGAVNIHQCGSGMKEVSAHPKTGIPFDGFRLPFWADAIELAKSGQRCFPMLPSLGWDIALTEVGPLIIEANSRWDPPLYAPFLMSSKNWRRLFMRHNPTSNRS
jgi:hypothetical protein